MTDRLGYRLKIGMIVPSTNTTVQPETDAMRPVGVTNHVGRIHIPDLPLSNDTGIRSDGGCDRTGSVFLRRSRHDLQAGASDHGDVDSRLSGAEKAGSEKLLREALQDRARACL